MLPKNDPANYRRVSEPFASQEEAQKAIDTFLDDEVAELRNKHRIKDVHICIEVHAITESGEVGMGMAAHLGDPSKALQMVASEFGLQKKMWDDSIGVAVRGKQR